VDGSGNPDAARTRAMEAVKLGCKAVVATVGVKGWPQWDRFRRGLGAPVLLKGVATVPEARAAVERGADGIVVSTYGRGNTATVSVLADLVDAVGGKVPVLVDGGFRRGTDILKALAFGAKAVLVVRPPLWGLAAYGPDGVQQVLELLQGELARSMAMCGIVDLSKMDRAFLRVHRR
jgi:isopentenyl diphosphate isomerase/L-lactate dehydrogenase-like FMN-dependent dehydrogenase